MAASSKQISLFTYKEYDEKLVFRLTDEKMPKRERMKAAVQYPEVLTTVRELSEEELEKVDYIKGSSKPIYKLSGRNAAEQELPWLSMLSAAKTKELGLWPILQEIREIISNRDFQAFLAKTRTLNHTRMRGKANDHTLSTIPGHQVQGIRLSAPLRHTKEEEFRKFAPIQQKITHLFGKADEIVLANMWGSKVKEEFDTIYGRRRIAEASLTNGHDMFSGTQYT